MTPKTTTLVTSNIIKSLYIFWEGVQLLISVRPELPGPPTNRPRRDFPSCPRSQQKSGRVELRSSWEHLLFQALKMLRSRTLSQISLGEIANLRWSLIHDLDISSRLRSSLNPDPNFYRDRRVLPRFISPIAANDLSFLFAFTLGPNFKARTSWRRTRRGSSSWTGPRFTRRPGVNSVTSEKSPARLEASSLSKVRPCRWCNA